MKSATLYIMLGFLVGMFVFCISSIGILLTSWVPEVPEYWGQPNALTIQEEYWAPKHDVVISIEMEDATVMTIYEGPDIRLYKIEGTFWDCLVEINGVCIEPFVLCEEPL